MTKDVFIIGGGLAGLTASILLAEKGYDVVLAERKSYPQHRVCGEYVSNEVLPFLKKHRLFPEEYEPVPISSFVLSDTQGRVARMPLDLGGFGISRYAFDHFLYKKALAAGVKVYTDSMVTEVEFHDNSFSISGGETVIEARTVIAAYGKQSRFDRRLERDFLERDNAYVGVKYHVEGPFNDQEVSLHNFKGGYCGLSAVEDGKFNLCYLARRDDLRECGSPAALERLILSGNPQLKDIFDKATMVFEKPLVINNFGFAPRTAIENHMLMAGDAAGLITPLCGNGMAMAIHGAKIAAEAIMTYSSPGNIGNRLAMESYYENGWNKLFRSRLAIGRRVQKLFGHPLTSTLAVGLASRVQPLARRLMEKTHGQPFA